jgi:hypothetical protein
MKKKTFLKRNDLKRSNPRSISVKIIFVLTKKGVFGDQTFMEIIRGPATCCVAARIQYYTPISLRPLI